MFILHLEHILLWTNYLSSSGSCCVYCLIGKSCPRLSCDPMDCSPPDSSVRGISQARILEWVPFPSPGAHPYSGIEPMSPALAGGFFAIEPSGKPCLCLAYTTLDNQFKSMKILLFCLGLLLEKENNSYENCINVVIYNFYSF